MTKRNPLEVLSEWMVGLAAIPILAMLLHITADVFVKYVFHFSIPGTLEVVSYYYMMAIVLMPLAAIELARQSIAVDLFFQMMSPRARKAAIAFVLVLSALTFGTMAAISWPDAVRAFEIGEIIMGSADVPIWPARFLLPVSMALTCLINLLLLVRLFTNAEAAQMLLQVDHSEMNQGVD